MVGMISTCGVHWHSAAVERTFQEKTSVFETKKTLLERENSRDGTLNPFSVSPHPSYQPIDLDQSGGDDAEVIWVLEWLPFFWIGCWRISVFDGSISHQREYHINDYHLFARGISESVDVWKMIHWEMCALLYCEGRSFRHRLWECEQRPFSSLCRGQSSHGILNYK